MLRLSSTLRRAAVLTAAVLLAGLGGAVGASSASADVTPNALIYATYPINGSTAIKSVNSTLTLGPGTLTAALDVATGNLTANLALPPATGTFTTFGFIPVTATTEFIQDGPVTGKDVNGGVQTTANVTLKMDDVKVAGLDVPVGNSCESATPAALGLNSDPGFNVLLGGNISGTYTIPKFAHCGLITPILNLLIPGAGNTITLTLGKPTISLTPPST